MEQQQIDNIKANLPIVLNSEGGINTVATLIFEGHLSLDELQENGMVTPSIRNLLQSKVDELRLAAQKAQQEMAEQQAEDAKWQTAVSEGSLSSYEDYIKCYPQGRYVERAQQQLRFLRFEAQQSQKQKYIDCVKNDINAYSPEVLSSYGITVEDLETAGISIPSGIKKLYSAAGVELTIGTTPSSIPDGQTEVYFWGAPGSGKTCTLAAILSTAKRHGYFIGQPCEGHLYMTQLSNVFHGDCGTLPPPTSVEVTQRLSFDLKDSQNVMHPVSLIELSGEVFQCLSNNINNVAIPTGSHQLAYNSLLGYLKNSTNPKYHFFVVDVSNDSVDALGFTQMDYLSDAATFFNQNNIFNNKTAGICILVTKSDLLSSDKTQRLPEAIRLLGEKYSSFISSIKQIAYNNRLIRNMSDPIPVIPFTIGDVYFQSKCTFDPQMSLEVIKVMQQNIAKTAVERKTRFLNW